jgi:hypothetical protein
MFIVVYKEVCTKALSILCFRLSLVPSLFMVTRVVNLLMPLLVFCGLFNKKNPLSKALITDTDKSIFWIYE